MACGATGAGGAGVGWGAGPEVFSEAAGGGLVPVTGLVLVASVESGLALAVGGALVWGAAG